MDRNRELLEEFENLCRQSPGPIPYSFTHRGTSKRHLTIASCTHGNEIGSLPAVIDSIKSLLNGESKPISNVTFVVGNPEAVKINQRFVEEDMNRVYGNLEKSSIEGQRAAQMAKLIKESDWFLDLHQTIGPTLCPFFIFAYHKESALLAQALGGVTEFITRNSKKGEYDDGSKTQNQFAIDLGKLSLTVELGPKGLNQTSITLAKKLIQKSIRLIDLSEKESLESLAKSSPPLSFFEIQHQESFGHPKKRLREGFKNLQAVHEREVLGTDENGQLLLSPFDGIILFPKYPPRGADGAAIGPLPNKIFEIARVITDNPDEYFSR